MARHSNSAVRNTTDPLAGVKLVTPAPPLAKDGLPPLLPGAEEDVKAKVDPDADAVVPPPQAPAQELQLRLLADFRTQWQGQTHRFPKGKVVSERSHGPGIFEALRAAGAPLEEVAD